MKLTSLILALLLCAVSAEGQIQAGAIWYEITNYGSKHAVVLLSGQGLENVTANLGSDGLSIRVSALTSEFRPGEKQSYGSLISEVQQVRRAQTNDLVINLSSPSDLSVTPAAQNIKLFIKVRRVSAAQAELLPKIPSVDKRKLKPLPLRFTRDPGVAGEKFGDGVLIVLPPSEGVNPLLGLSFELRRFAYAIDVIWAWVTGRPIEYDGQNNSAVVSSSEVIELEKLVKELTQELIELRKQNPPSKDHTQRATK
jgi:hypothetical protein